MILSRSRVMSTCNAEKCAIEGLEKRRQMANENESSAENENI
jgi:hypothetical protein